MKKILLVSLLVLGLNINADAQRKQAGIYHQAKYEIMHYVKKGQTLSQIAEYYSTTTSTLKNYNNIENSSKIKPNQLILVPSTFSVDYIKNTLEIPESRFRLMPINGEEDLYFDDKSSGNAQHVENVQEDVNYVPGRVITPKSKPRPKAAKTKAQYEAEKAGIVQTQPVTTTTNRPAVSTSERPVSNNAATYNNKEVISTTQNVSDGRFRYHLVKTGETLYSLSKAYNVTIEQIKEWNNISANNQLPLGENIIVGLAQAVPTEIIQEVKPAQNTKDVKFHVVKQGETLYSIAKSYNLDIESLKLFNKFNTNELSVGQQIMIPSMPEGNEGGFLDDSFKRKNEYTVPQSEGMIVYNGNDAIADVTLYETPVAVVPPAQNYTKPAKAKSIYHTVKVDETLYRISKMYNTSVAELQEMNNFPSDYTTIEPGDVIVIGYAALKGDYQTTPDNSDADEFYSEDVPSGKITQMEKFKRAFNIKNKRKDIYEIVRDMGMGQWDRQREATSNNLYCLHASAPKNSIIKVINPMNNATIYVKVLGKLEPKIGEENVDIKLTTQAIKMLRILDDRFRIKMEFHAQR